MSGHDNTFNIERIRPSNSPSTQNSMCISTSHPPAHYPLGLTQLVFGREKNIRIKAYIDKVSFVESSGTFDAIVHLDAWCDSILYSAACTWLPIPKPDREFQHGKKTIKSDRLVHGITFDQEFTSTPKIVIWLSALDLEKGAGWQITLETAAVTTKGFILKCKTWSNTRLYSAEATWIAYPASRQNIDSGSFYTSELRKWNEIRHEHSKIVKFSKNFVRPPRIFFALSRIDSKNSADLRLKAYVTDVTAKEMTLHLDSWEDLNMYSTEGQWIAIQYL